MVMIMFSTFVEDLVFVIRKKKLQVKPQTACVVMNFVNSNRSEDNGFFLSINMSTHHSFATETVSGSVMMLYDSCC